MNKLHAIIIEDDPCDVELLKQILHKNCPYITISGFAKNIEEATKAMKKNKFDIIFLDINLGSDCAFELLKTSSSKIINEKELIITSSHKKYALEAFKYVATDYVLKPIAPDDIILAVEKARKNIDLKRSSSKQNEEFYTKEPLKMIAIPSLNDVKIIPVDDIVYLQSEGRYTIFYTSKNTTLVSSKNLGEYEKVLAHNHFFRIHHSYLVNVNYALNVQKKDGAYLEIPNQKYLPISKRKTDLFYQFLGIR